MESRLERDGYWPMVCSHINQHLSYDEQSDLFVKAAMFWQPDLAFDQDFYARLGQRFRTLPRNKLPNDSEEKKL